METLIVSLAIKYGWVVLLCEAVIETVMLF
jgi:hypothetical protein